MCVHWPVRVASFALSSIRSTSLRYRLLRTGEITPPTMLQTTLLGATLKRGWTDSIHDAHLLLVDLDFLHQRPNDLPSRVPVRLFQHPGNPLRELLQLADHQPQLRFPALLDGPPLALALKLR